MPADRFAATRAALDERDAHRRQLGLVRASVAVRPPLERPTHRRWA
jgi:hypothetical protein